MANFEKYIFFSYYRADTETRTLNLRSTKPLRFQLRYIGKIEEDIPLHRPRSSHYMLVFVYEIGDLWVKIQTYHQLHHHHDFSNMIVWLTHHCDGQRLVLALMGISLVHHSHQVI